MINLNTHLSCINRFIETVFPDSAFVMIAGSITTTSFNENSDIDIVILSSQNLDPYIEAYSFENIKMQVIMIPIRRLNELFIQESIQGQGVYLTMFHSGVIIRDSENLLKIAKAKATTIYNQGPLPTSQYDLDQMRSVVTTRLEDLQTKRSFDDCFFIAIDTYMKLLHLYTKTNRLWHSVGKFASQELKRRDPDFHQDFITSFNQFMKSEDPSSLADFVDRTINKIGGPLHFYSTRNIHERITDNKCIIFIDYGLLNMNDDILSLIKRFRKSVLKTQNLIYNICCVTQQSVLNKGIYITIRCPKQKIQEHLLPLIKLFQINLANKYLSISRNWIYPHQIDPIAIFGKEEQQNSVLELLTYINELFYNELETKTFSSENATNFAIFILKHLREATIFTPLNNYSAFLSFSFEYYIEANQTAIGNVRNFYKDINLSEFRDRLNSCADQYRSLYFTPNIPSLEIKIQELEQFYILNEDHFLFLYESALIKYSMPQKDKLLFAFFYKIMEKILQLCFLNNKDEAYCIYTLGQLDVLYKKQ